MRLFGKKKPEHKFCPVCGTQLRIEDAHCIRCGYSFIARHKKMKKRVKWKNIVLLLIILAAVYFGLRYYAGQPVIPVSLNDALNFTKIK